MNADTTSDKPSRPWRTLGLAVLVGGIAVALALPALTDVGVKSRRQADRDHLTRLWGTAAHIHAGGIEPPTSTGYRHWLALYVGDPPEGPPSPWRNRGFGLHPEAHMLLFSAFDPAADPATADALLRALRNQQSGEAGNTPPVTHADLGPTHCSYAGPTTDTLTRLAAGTLPPDAIVGATADRNNLGLDPAGSTVIRANGSLDFLPYPAAHPAPDWQSPALSTVTWLESPTPTQTRPASD